MHVQLVMAYFITYIRTCKIVWKLEGTFPSTTDLLRCHVGIPLDYRSEPWLYEDK